MPAPPAGGFPAGVVEGLPAPKGAKGPGLLVAGVEAPASPVVSVAVAVPLIPPPNIDGCPLGLPMLKGFFGAWPAVASAGLFGVEKSEGAPAPGVEGLFCAPVLPNENVGWFVAPDVLDVEPNRFCDGAAEAVEPKRVEEGADVVAPPDPKIELPPPADVVLGFPNKLPPAWVLLEPKRLGAPLPLLAGRPNEKPAGLEGSAMAAGQGMLRAMQGGGEECV